MTAFPDTETVLDSNFDDGMDNPYLARADFEHNASVLQQIIDSFGDNSGICPLDTSGQVPSANLNNTTVTLKDSILNGDFRCVDYGTSGSAAGYVANHVYLGLASSTAVWSIEDHDIDGLVQFDSPNFLRVTVTSASTAGSQAVIILPMEHVRKLAGKSKRVRLWMKASAAGKYAAVELVQYFGSGGSASSTISGIGATKLSELGTTWPDNDSPAVVDVDIPSISTKTIDGDKDHSQLYIWLDAGSDYDSRTGSLGNQSGTFDIALTQVVDQTDASYTVERLTDQQNRIECSRFAHNFGTGSIYAIPQFPSATSWRGVIPLLCPVRNRDAVTWDFTSYNFNNIPTSATGDSTYIHIVGLGGNPAWAYFEDYATNQSAVAAVGDLFMHNELI